MLIEFEHDRVHRSSSRGTVIDDALLPHLSPLGWDHINVTGDYVWSDALPLDEDGYMPLKLPPI